MNPLLALAIGLAALNAATWASYRIDKARAARGARRTSERTLLALALVGGSLGALAGMYAHRRRHKTSKLRFVVALWAIVVLQAAAIVVIWRWRWP